MSRKCGDDRNICKTLTIYTMNSWTMNHEPAKKIYFNISFVRQKCISFIIFVVFVWISKYKKRNSIIIFDYYRTLVGRQSAMLVVIDFVVIVFIIAYYCYCCFFSVLQLHRATVMSRFTPFNSNSTEYSSFCVFDCMFNKF